MKQYTRDDYKRDHLDNEYVDNPLSFVVWIGKMGELDWVNAKLDRMIEHLSSFNEEEYWEQEKKCSELCDILGF